MTRIRAELREDQRDLNTTIVEGRNKEKLSTAEVIALHRGFKFRGVIRNETKWQAMVKIKSKKQCIGSYNTQEEAAIEYDRHALLLHGLKVRV